MKLIFALESQVQMNMVENRNFYLEIEDKVQTQSRGVQTQEIPIGDFPEMGSFCQRV